MTAHKIEDVNSAEADIGTYRLHPSAIFYSEVFPGAQVLIDNIADTRTMLASLKLSKSIPVGNSDAGSYFSTKVLEKVEYGVIIVIPTLVIRF